MEDKIRILFVCMGNICRSPSAEAVMKKLVKDRGLENRMEIDSAGTIGHHAGEMADARMRTHAERRGITLDSISRPVVEEDFYRFDLIIGMDDYNISELKRKAPDWDSVRKIHKMTDFSIHKTYDHVPDPYYGGAAGFELVLDLLEDACRGLLACIEEKSITFIH
ncbi:MAG: low molecular weight phosphotyrosine protein phosphatase [Tannerellaceae bacterium]|nr:low molecular weight phosphotyrosine protein phosphatase [Tannerellaceae bacterium]